MKRREFIAGLGGTAVAWPLAARAQQPATPVIGFFRSSSAADSSSLVKAFRQGLKEAGFVEGQNVAIEFRWADSQMDRVPAIVAELIGRPVTVMVGNVAPTLAAKAASTTVPIVFITGGDPVRDGFVTSMSRPGGNITGVSFLTGEVGAKRLELLRQLVPTATIIGVLVNRHSPNTEANLKAVQGAASAVGQQLIVLDVSSDGDIEQAFATLVQRGAAAVFVGAGAFTFGHRKQLVALAARHALPTSYGNPDSVEDGGLMSYGPSQTDAYRQAGVYVGRILNGAKPADLPVMQSVKFEFAINLKTAKALGITFPPTLLALADKVIE
jgi:putative tryptophan/tyrosine transport system substrate-binding protein